MTSLSAESQTTGILNNMKAQVLNRRDMLKASVATAALALTRDFYGVVLDTRTDAIQVAMSSQNWNLSSNGCGC